jgi:hypothetical protein
MGAHLPQMVMSVTVMMMSRDRSAFFYIIYSIAIAKLGETMMIRASVVCSPVAISVILACVVCSPAAISFQCPRRSVSSLKEDKGILHLKFGSGILQLKFGPGIKLRYHHNPELSNVTQFRKFSMIWTEHRPKAVLIHAT